MVGQALEVFSRHILAAVRIDAASIWVALISAVILVWFMLYPTVLAMRPITMRTTMISMRENPRRHALACFVREYMVPIKATAVPTGRSTIYLVIRQRLIVDDRPFDTPRPPGLTDRQRITKVERRTDEGRDLNQDDRRYLGTPALRM